MVKATLTSECRKVETVMQNIDSILESFSEAAERLERSKCAEGVEGTKECFKKMLHTQAELAALRSAMTKLEQQYQTPASEIETDFKGVLEEAAATEFERRNFNAAEHELYTKLLEDIADVNSDEEAAADDDEDLQIDRNSRTLAPNATCPLSTVQALKQILFWQLLELKDPVQDQKGFVYEREAILNYIRRAPGGTVSAPTAGATHVVSVTDLKPAKKVLREQKKARNHPTQTQRPDEGDVLDVA